jgi:transposase
MRMIVTFLLFSSIAFASLTEDERSHLRQMSMTFCSCRGGTHTIFFDKEQPLAKVFCRNEESRVFRVEEKYEACK